MFSKKSKVQKNTQLDIISIKVKIGKTVLHTIIKKYTEMVNTKAKHCFRIDNSYLWD